MTYQTFSIFFNGSTGPVTHPFLDSSIRLGPHQIHRGRTLSSDLQLSNGSCGPSTSPSAEHPHGPDIFVRFIRSIWLPYIYYNFIFPFSDVFRYANFSSFSSCCSSAHESVYHPRINLSLPEWSLTDGSRKKNASKIYFLYYSSVRLLLLCFFVIKQHPAVGCFFLLSFSVYLCGGLPSN